MLHSPQISTALAASVVFCVSFSVGGSDSTDSVAERNDGGFMASAKTTPKDATAPQSITRPHLSIATLHGTSQGSFNDTFKNIAAQEENVDVASPMPIIEEKDYKNPLDKNGHLRNPVIDTPKGRLIGTHASDSVDQFLGIKFAEVMQRFVLPTPVKAWAPNVYDATNYGAKCYQPWENVFASLGSVGTQQYSYDCLHLNIWKPRQMQELVPVMVWIHGGGNMAGSGSDKMYDGVNMVTHENVVVVSIEYRLGVFGQLASKEIQKENPEFPTTGGMNYLLDQIQALRWVRDNIQYFGGDPNKVTIFGESAGGISVCNHLASPLSRGLFNRAILESGPCSGPWGPTSTEIGLKAGVTCAAQVGCIDKTKLLTCMRAVPWSKMVKTCIQPYISIDGLVLKEDPAVIFERGDFTLHKGAEVLMGFNSGDSLIGWPYFITGQRNITQMTETDYRKRVMTYFPTYGHEVLRLYPFRRKSGRAYVHINADVCVVCPLLKLAHQLTRTRDIKVYVYLFSWNPTTGSYHNFAGHAGEVPSVFDNKGVIFPLNEDLSRNVQHAWANFAKKGNPTPSKRPGGLPRWGQYNIFDPNKPKHLIMNLSTPSTMASLDIVNLERCALWEDSDTGYVNEPRANKFCSNDIDATWRLAGVEERIGEVESKAHQPTWSVKELHGQQAGGQQVQTSERSSLSEATSEQQPEEQLLEALDAVVGEDEMSSEADDMALPEIW